MSSKNWNQKTRVWRRLDYVLPQKHDNHSRHNIVHVIEEERIRPVRRAWESSRCWWWRYSYEFRNLWGKWPGPRFGYADHPVLIACFVYYVKSSASQKKVIISGGCLPSVGQENLMISTYLESARCPCPCGEPMPMRAGSKSTSCCLRFVERADEALRSWSSSHPWTLGGSAQ